MAASRRAAADDQVLLAAIVEGSRDAIVGVSLDGAILSWNPAAERLYGYSADEALRLPLSALDPPGTVDGLGRVLEGIDAGGSGVRFEAVHARADGRRATVSVVVVSPLLDGSGDALGASLVAREIGEAGSSEAKFRNLLESARDAVVIVAEDGTIGLVDARTEAMFGYSRQELLGRSVELLMPERLRGRHSEERGSYG